MFQKGVGRDDYLILSSFPKVESKWNRYKRFKNRSELLSRRKVDRAVTVNSDEWQVSRKWISSGQNEWNVLQDRNSIREKIDFENKTIILRKYLLVRILG